MPPSLLRAGIVGVLALLIAGCTAYSGARASFPHDPRQKIALRVRSAQIAAHDLEEQLTAPSPDAASLESYSWELSRRIASVRDLSPHSTEVQKALALMDKATFWASQAQNAAANGDKRGVSVLCAQARASLMNACALTNIELARLAEQPGSTQSAAPRLSTRAGVVSNP